MRGRGRGGRGRGRSGNRNSGRGKGSTQANKQIKSEKDCICHLGTAKSASQYTEITRILINHVRKNYSQGKDIGDALETLTEFNATMHKPMLQQSTDMDAAKKAVEDKQFEIEYKTEYNQYMKQRQQYEENKGKAYAFLWFHCHHSMQHKIEARTDYNTINQNPIKLLKAIKQHALNYQENRYPMLIIYDLMKTVFNTKQREDENLNQLHYVCISGVVAWHRSDELS